LYVIFSSPLVAVCFVAVFFPGCCFLLLVGFFFCVFLVLAMFALGLVAFDGHGSGQAFLVSPAVACRSRVVMERFRLLGVGWSATVWV
jgi:hypothetical protein